MLLSLPNELLLDIVENLTDISDVYSLLMTSKHLSNLLQPLLDKESEHIQEAAIAREIPLIHFAAFEDNQIIAKLAIKLDPQCVNSVYLNHRTALHIATDKGFVAMVQLLLNNRADPNAISTTEALPVAALNLVLDNIQWQDFAEVPLTEKFIQITYHLLQAGANPNLPGRNRENALIQVARLHIPKLLISILDTGLVDINSRGAQGTTALHNTVLFSAPGIDEVATILLQRGIDMNAVDHLGRTALFETCSEWGNRNTTALLVQYGTDINIQDVYGMTVLHHLAIFAYHPHSVVAMKQLLRSCIPIQFGLRDNRKKTAYEYALDSGNSQLSKLLEE